MMLVPEYMSRASPASMAASVAKDEMSRAISRGILPWSAKDFGVKSQIFGNMVACCIRS